MDMMKSIKERRSVRTFDSAPINTEDLERLTAHMKNIENPYGIQVDFVLLDAAEPGLATPVTKGERLYVAGKVMEGPYSEEAFGYSFEKLVLKAWSMGIGTTIIAGTMNRKAFEEAAGLKEGERMYCMSPIGYPASRMAIKEVAMRKGVKADTRKPAEELFFENDFDTPLDIENLEKTSGGGIADALEAVRLAPSAVNKQPWRVVRNGDAFHFYVRHNKNMANDVDIQKVDVGIALCHFMSIAGGYLTLDDPGIETPDKIEYLATVILNDNESE